MAGQQVWGSFSCPILPRAQIAGTRHCTQVFLFGPWGMELWTSCMCGECITNWAISRAPRLILIANLRVWRTTLETHLWAYLLWCFQKSLCELGGPTLDEGGITSQPSSQTEQGESELGTSIHFFRLPDYKPSLSTHLLPCPPCLDDLAPQTTSLSLCCVCQIFCHSTGKIN